MSYNNSFFPAFQFLAEPYVVFAHQPMNLPYSKGRHLVAAEVPLEQLQRWLWTSLLLLYKWLGMIIWLGQLLASMIFLRYHLWPFDHSPFIFMAVHLSLNWTSNCSAHGCPSKRQPFLSLVTRPPFCSDTARFGLGFFARHLSMAMPAMQLCYGSMDATIETRLGAHSTTP